MPLMSIVIPTYNRAAILAQCLDALYREQEPVLSAAHGSGLSFEVIVVDDGSTDETASVLRREEGRWEGRLRFLMQENHGPAVARNTGAAAGGGELLLFLGDDNIVEHGYLTRLYAEYQRHSGEVRGVLGYLQYRADSVPTPFGRWYETESNLTFVYRFARTDVPLPFWLFYTAGVLLPRQIFLAVGGFNSGLRQASYEDTELSYRLVAQGFKLYYCPAARALHVHPVTVRAIGARMRMRGLAAVSLATVNAELFDRLYPPKVGDFRSRNWKHRLRQWILAKPGLLLLGWAETRLPLRVVRRVGRPILLSVENLEMARLGTAERRMRNVE